MDTTKTITHVGLCAGYGGIELGLKRVLPSLRTVALCEIEAFACANLVAKMEAGLMDPAPIWTDLKTFPWDSFRDRVDILTGGYPCQPFSSAGKRLGTEDPRHLWPFIADGIRRLAPRVCFFENVEGHISLGLREVVGELEELGYTTTWGIFSAAETGAPHQRKRVFIMAHRDSERGQLSDWRQQSAEQVSIGNGAAWGDVWPSRPGEPQHAWEPPRVVANSRYEQPSGWDNAANRQQFGTGGISRSQLAPCGGESSEPAHKSLGNPESGARLGRASGDEGHAAQPDESVGDASDAGQPQRGSGALGRFESEQEPQRPDCNHDDTECEAEPALGRDTDGPASGLDYAELCESCDNRTDELRLLGNGVVPATAALAFRTLLDSIQAQWT